jgi:hypothetical protein
MVRRGQLLDAIGSRERQIAWLQAQQRLDVARLVREDRSGMYARYVADELAMVWRRSPRQCRNRTDSAQVFADFPAVHALIEDGTWLMDHVDAALDTLVGSGLTCDQQQQVLDLVLSRRVHLTPWQIRQAVRTAIVVLFPEHVADQAENAERDRDVRVYDEGPGAASLLASGPAQLVAAMMASLDALARPSTSDDPRTLAQRRFDVLLALVAGEIRPTNWQVHALVELATLQGQDELPADLPGFAPLPAPIAREMAAQGELRRVVVDEQGTLVAVEGRVHRPDLPPDETHPLPQPHPTAPDDAQDEDAGEDAVEDDTGERSDGPVDDEPDEDDLRWYAQHRPLMSDEEPIARTGGRPAYLRPRWSPEGWQHALHRLRTDPFKPLLLESDCYVPPRALKRHVELRDRTCIFPGCPRRASECDKDHLIPFPRGSTSEINLADECDHHHHGKHEYFTVERRPDGTFRWRSPTGVTADRAPRLVLDAHRFRPPRAR